MLIKHFVQVTHSLTFIRNGNSVINFSLNTYFSLRSLLPKGAYFEEIEMLPNNKINFVG